MDHSGCFVGNDKRIPAKISSSFSREASMRVDPLYCYFFD